MNAQPKQEVNRVSGKTQTTRLIDPGHTEGNPGRPDLPLHISERMHKRRTPNTYFKNGTYSTQTPQRPPGGRKPAPNAAIKYVLSPTRSTVTVPKNSNTTIRPASKAIALSTTNFEESELLRNGR